MRDWTLAYEGIDPASEGIRETLCTLGNGYLATRGAAPEHDADGVHYPGTYVAGIYDRLVDHVAGRRVENESLVNLPNWLPLSFRAEDGPWLGTGGVELLEHHLELDVARGLLVRRLRCRDDAGRTTRVTQRRFVHMEHAHLAGLETVLVPEDWDGRLTVRSGVDGGVENAGVARYRDLDGRHLCDHEVSRPDDDVLLVTARTRQSRIRLAVAARTRAWVGDDAWPGAASLVDAGRRAWLQLDVDATAGVPVRVEKVAAVFTSRDRAISEPATEAVTWVRRADTFAGLVRSHLLAWVRLWRRFRLELDGSDGETAPLPVLRLHLFHLLQTLSPGTIDLDVGVPARGLHGEAYRGHVLWDELFVVPLLGLRLPVLARTLLMYRHRRLPEARWAARQAGRRGAMYPWQSGSSGREESQRLHLNPLSGRWVEDATHLQRHVGLAIAYNAWEYWESSADSQFLSHHGAEMILEVARFFADLASYDRESGRYRIRGVVGPDEFHTHYPGAATPGIDDNAYTNVMAAWVLARAFDLLDLLPDRRRRELTRALDLRTDELRRMDAVSRRLLVPFHDGVISQFAGYADLAELDWAAYRDRYGDIQRLDRILEAEGDDPNRYKASKQADVLMLFYLLTAEDLTAVLDRLGYRLEPTTIPDTIEYYLARTTHGSTLSAVVHAWVLARSQRGRALEFLRLALDSDVTDIQGGTTAEGIHLAAMAGSVDLLQRCFTGLETRRDTLWLNPSWPEELGRLETDVVYRTVPLTLRVHGDRVLVSSDPSAAASVRVGCRGKAVVLEPGDTAGF